MTANSRRKLTIPPALIPVFAKLIDGKGPDELVFTTVEGRPLRHSNFVDRVLKPALKLCGDSVPEGVRPHTFRHTNATWLLALGATLYQVSRQLGHTSVMTTEKHYAAKDSSTRDQNADRLNMLLAAGGAPARFHPADIPALADVVETRLAIEPTDRLLPALDEDELDGAA